MHVIETIDSIELADVINRSWLRIKTASKSPTRQLTSDELLNIMIQINTSGEERMLKYLFFFNSIHLFFKTISIKKKMVLVLAILLMFIIMC